jgi:hypothetical protein
MLVTHPILDKLSTSSDMLSRYEQSGTAERDT